MLPSSRDCRVLSPGGGGGDDHDITTSPWGPNTACALYLRTPWNKSYSISTKPKAGIRAVRLYSDSNSIDCRFTHRLQHGIQRGRRPATRYLPGTQHYTPARRHRRPKGRHGTHHSWRRRHHIVPHRRPHHPAPRGSHHGSLRW